MSDLLKKLHMMCERHADRRDQILTKVLHNSIVTPGPLETDCWLWNGPTSGEKGRGSGYPRMNLDGATVAVHRAMWTNEHGIIPPKKQIDHKCRVRRCVNPDHLEMVTHKQNQKRRDAVK